MQMQMSLNKKKELEKEEIIVCTANADRMGTSTDQQHNVLIADQSVRVEEICHNNNEEQNEKPDKEDEVKIIHCEYVYERRKKEMHRVQAFNLFAELTSRHEVRLEGQQRDAQISVPTFSGGLKTKKKGRGRKSQARNGSSSRSVPRKRNLKSGREETEDGEVNSRRWTYLPGKNEKSPSIFDHASKQFELVDGHIGYKESLLKFAQDLGPTAQRIALEKIAQTTTHAIQAPVPHPSSTLKLSDDPKGKNVIMDRGTERHSVSAGDKRPMGLSDREGTLSAGSAGITSFPDASKIQRSVDVVQRSVREHAPRPAHNHTPLVLQQQLQTPSNAIVESAYTARAGYQVPIAYEPRPKQNSYPWTTVRPYASGSSYGVWGGHHSTPSTEIQRHAYPATPSHGFQQTSPNPHMQLQNQQGSEARQQQQLRPEQQPLPLLRNMFNAGTTHAGNFSAVSNHPTTSNAARNAQRLPMTQRSYPNLELQLRTKPPSP